jgi:hypothetical protein
MAAKLPQPHWDFVNAHNARQPLLSQRAARLARLLVRSHGNVTFQRRYAPQIKEKAQNVAAIAEISLN